MSLAILTETPGDLEMTAQQLASETSVPPTVYHQQIEMELTATQADEQNTTVNHLSSEYSPDHDSPRSVPSNG